MYAFDDCSILHLCSIKIPELFKIYFDKAELTHKNYYKLDSLIKKIDKKHKFVPNNIANKMIAIANELLQGYNVQLLGNTFKARIIDQLEEFYEDIKDTFVDIQKKDCIVIKDIFSHNIVELKKKPNMPGDDDLSIISGYNDIQSEDDKHIITGDEHFWGYKDLILTQFNIKVIEEWNCHKLP